MVSPLLNNFIIGAIGFFLGVMMFFSGKFFENGSNREALREGKNVDYSKTGNTISKNDILGLIIFYLPILILVLLVKMTPLKITWWVLLVTLFIGYWAVSISYFVGKSSKSSDGADDSRSKSSEPKPN
ncbi:MAG TPA: hypothetical protein VEP89_16120 [Draconibacterium sp.]|nr:hypothetical protein [Draconibacterium sp.]